MSRLLAVMAVVCVLMCAPGASASQDPGPVPAVESSPDDPGPLANVKEYMVPTPEMPDVKVRMWKATNGSTKSIVLLDGLRATWDISGWEHETNAHLLANYGVNVIEPVGGDASFYADWDRPSKGANQPYRYMWETFLVKTLPAWEGSIGLDPHANAIGILSLAGPSAMVIAAKHPDVYKAVSTYSAPLDMENGGRGMICVSQWSQQGYDCDSMWGADGYNDKWRAHDPAANLDALRNISIYVSYGNGQTGPWDDAYGKRANYNTINEISAQVIEGVIKGNVESFRKKADAAGLPVTYNVEPAGTHMWAYWEENLWLSLDQMKAAINA